MSSHTIAFFAGAMIFAGAAEVNAPPAVADSGVGVVASNWKFTPAKVEAHVGQATQLNLTSTEGVHGIESADLGIPMTSIAPDKPSQVTFTPKKAGTYAVHCAIVCGAGHANMVLTINVVP